VTFMKNQFGLSEGHAGASQQKSYEDCFHVVVLWKGVQQWE
jgi:hypothetical protein